MTDQFHARWLYFAVFLATATAMSGCNRLLKRHASHALPYTTQPPANMTVNERAQRLNSRGLRAFEIGHLAKAEQLFRDALDEDLNFGPAHNNLGQVYLARHQLYLAAWEFEYASSLMPELVEPIISQGLAYETGERIDRAIAFYEQAYAREPNHTIAIASLVRAKIKSDADPLEIGLLLDELIMHDGRPEWIEWAKELRSTRYRDQCEDCLDNDGGAPAEFNHPFEIDGPTEMRDQLLPIEELPMTRPEQHEAEEIYPPDASILLPPPANGSLPRNSEQSWLPDRQRPRRLPEFGPSATPGDEPFATQPAGTVRPVSFDGPLIMPELVP